MAANLASVARFENDMTISVIKCLSILTEASATKESLCQGQSEHLIENVLQQNLKSLQSWMINEKNASLQKSELFNSLKKILGRSADKCPNVNKNSRHLFSSTCILLLSRLTDLLNSSSAKVETSNQQRNESDEVPFGNAGGQDENSCPVLSVQQTKQISTCIQFVIVFGLCPYIPQGIGIPISERLGPGQVLLASAEDTVTDTSESSRLQNLLPILKLLVKMINCVHLRDLLTEKFLSDIFIVLIQVRHSAKIIQQQLKTLESAKKSSESDANKEKSLCTDNTERSQMSNQFVENDDDEVSQDCGKNLTIESMEKLVQECNIDLDGTIRNAPVSLVLREVLCLLGFVKSNQGFKSVPWFRRIMAGILRDIIIHPPGVQHLLTAFLGDLSSFDTKDWQNCKAVARIISHCPVNAKNVEQFYLSVSQQLLELIHPRESSVPLTITKAVGAAVFELDSLQSELMNRFCFSHLITPLTDCSANNESLSSRPPGAVVVEEKKLTTCISHCHKLFIIGQERQSSLCAKLELVLGVLFSLHVHIRQSASYLKGMIKDLLTSCLSVSETKDVVGCLLEMLLPSSNADVSFPPVHPDVCFVSAADGGVEAVVTKDQDTNIESWTHPACAIVDLLKSLKSDALNSDLFIALLQRLTNIVVSETNQSSDILMPVRVVAPEVKVSRLKELKEKVALVTLISGVGDEFGSSIIQNTSQILAFTKVTLDRCVAMCALSGDTDTRMFEWQTVTMSLGLLSAVLGMGCMFTKEDKKMLDSILPLLSSLAQSESVDSHIRDMASDLKVSVATRGLVSVNISGENKPKSTMEKDEEKVAHDKLAKTSAKPLIEVLSSEKMKKENDSNQECDMSRDDDMWKMAMKEVEDPQIPVKGHGLIQLARMVEDRQKGAITHSPVLLKIFMENLDNSDSYIYLASVNGLAALSDLRHEEVIPSLTSQFRSKCKDDLCSWETTLKVGEAIVKATRRLGEVAPKYRDVLLSALLCGSHHDNSLVRASCLSGLADICKLLRYSISPVIQEVLMCCRLVLTSEPDADPRRAAALTLSSLLQGLGKDALTVLGEEMKELYRTLKHAAQLDTDEKVKVHAQLALEELDGIMKGFLFPSQDLKKSIKILGYQ